MGQTDTGAAQGVAEAGEQAKEQARQVGQQAAEKGREAAGAARGRAREQVDQRSTQAGEQLSTLAGDARTVGEELRKQGKDQPARLAEQAAERVERVGDYLRRSDAETILQDVEDFGRRQPLAVAAGGFVVGLLASRFLKASSAQRYSGARSAQLDGSRGSGPAYDDRQTGAEQTAALDREAAPETTEGVGAGTGTRPTGMPAHR